MADSTLQAIRTKVRRITRSPSISQISDADIDEYVNTFIQYDFPEHLRLFDLRTTFTFYTQPYQDQYPTDIISFAGVTTNPLYNFKNRYISVHDPVYISGYRAFYSQSREQFFGVYPFVNFQIATGLTGDGVTFTFTGTITPPGNSPGTGLLQRKVVLSAIDITGNGLAMVDVPVVDVLYGNNTQTGNLYLAGSEPATPPIAALANNNINYATGVFTVTFPTAPANQDPIEAQVVPTIISQPLALLFYDNIFTVRPVPDQAYPVQFEAYVRPTELLAANASPQLEQWWQYIAFNCAKKIFEDRSDSDSVNLIMPALKEQERLVLRKTIVQQTNERTATIYTENVAGMYGSGWWSGGGPF